MKTRLELLFDRTCELESKIKETVEQDKLQKLKEQLIEAYKLYNSELVATIEFTDMLLDYTDEY